MNVADNNKHGLHIAVIVEFRHVYGRNGTRGICRYVKEKRQDIRLDIIFYDTDNAPPDDFKIYDGVITTRDCSLLDKIPDTVPLLCLGFENKKNPELEVQLDNGKIGALAAEVFIKRGTVSYCYYDGLHSNTQADKQNSRQRCDGFQSCIDANAPQLIQKHFFYQNSLTLKALVEWLTDIPKPASILAYNDLGAVNLAEACRVGNLRIPDDISIIGTDNDSLYCMLSRVSLSSIDHNIEKIGYEAARYLISHIEGPAESFSRGGIIPVPILRESTGHIITNNSIVQKALDILNLGGKQQINPRILAHSVGCSQRALEVLFKDELKSTVQSQIVSGQLNQVKRLLRETELSVEEIAEQIDWEPPSLYRAFKRSFKQSPGCYRGMFRENSNVSSYQKKSSRNQKTIMVGVLSLMNNLFFLKILEGIEIYFRKQKNIYLLLSFGASNEFMMTKNQNFPEGGEVEDCDGFIASLDVDIPEKILGDKPIITFEHHRNAKRCKPYLVDNRSAGVIAAEYFLRKKYSKFAFGGYEEPWSKGGDDVIDDRSEERFNGFRDTLIEAGVLPENITFFRYHGETKADKYLLSLSERTALYLFNDYLAMLVLNDCNRLGLRVPEDIALLGTDNNEFICMSTKPAISSVDVCFVRAGYEIAESLLEMIRNGSVEETEIKSALARRVIERDSTQNYGFDDPDVESVIQFIKEHFASDMNVDHIVGELSLNRRTAEKRFKRILGRSIAEELQYRRIQEAAGLLASTSLPVDEVASRCGFKKTAHFCKVFKVQMHMTPLHFRAPRHKGISGYEIEF